MSGNASESESESISASTPRTIIVPNTQKKHRFIQLKETVKDKVFPRAKFLRAEDLQYSAARNSWCQKLAKECHIKEDAVQAWWQAAKRVVLVELAQQRSNKTNVIKREFFGKVPYLRFIDELIITNILSFFGRINRMDDAKCKRR